MRAAGIGGRQDRGGLVSFGDPEAGPLVLAPPESARGRAARCGDLRGRGSDPAAIRADLPFAEFERDDRTLCLDPISGQWTVCLTGGLESARTELAAKRAAWIERPPADETLAPPRSVTVPIKNKRCNLRCDYCFAESENVGGYASAEEIGALIRLTEDLHPDRIRFLVFHGGEPLVDWRTIRDVVRRYRERGGARSGETRFSMVSNGTLVTREIASEIRELGFDSVCISLDGPAEVHDKARRYLYGRGSFDRAFRGFELLRDSGVPTTTLSTIVDPGDLPGAFAFLAELGLFQMFLRPLRWQGRAIPLLQEVAGAKGEDDYQTRFAAGLMSVASLVIDHNRRGGPQLMEYGLAMRVSHLIRPERPYMCMRSPCGAVSGHKLGLDGKGQIFPCDTMVEFPELAIGSLRDLDTAPKLRRAIENSPVMRELRRRRVENIPKCSTCHVQRFCGGECTAASYGRFGALNREGDRCVLEQTLFVELLWKIAEDVRNIEWLSPGSFRRDAFSWCADAGATG